MKTKEKILSLAISLFAQKGYNGVSMRELAQSANLGVAGLYHYFPNKEALYQQAIKQYFSNKALSFSDIWQGNMPAKDKLSLFVHSLLKMMRDDNDFHRLLQQELLSADAGRLKSLADDIFKQQFSELIKLSMELFPKQPPYLMAVSILSLVFYHLEMQPLGRYLPAYQEKYEDMDMLTKHIVSLLSVE